jgi:hypothetical protein
MKEQTDHALIDEKVKPAIHQAHTTLTMKNVE